MVDSTRCCIDEKSLRFLDDAVSIERLEPKSVVRVSIHVADADELTHSGSTIDRLARERGKSLHLPLKARARSTLTLSPPKYLPHPSTTPVKLL